MITPTDITKMISRFFIDRKNRKRLKNKDFSLITSNCMSGVISHDLGLRFLSPTVNLYFDADDFVKFCENLEHYLKMPLVHIKDAPEAFPVAMLDDIKVYGMHYKTFEELEGKWRERAGRVNLDNLFFMMGQKDGCTEETLRRFDELPYKNKVVFTCKPMPQINCAYYIPGTESKEEPGSISNIMLDKGLFTGRKFIDDFDYVSFLNGKN